MDKIEKFRKSADSVLKELREEKDLEKFFKKGLDIILIMDDINKQLETEKNKLYEKISTDYTGEKGKEISPGESG